MGANAQTSVPLFVANAVLTAAQQNISAATGVPVFATTVTRDAAFGGSNKALAEGQLCYLESTDVVQYYTGAAWVTVGPVTAATTAFTGGQQTSASTSFAGLTTATAVTVTTGTSALVVAIARCMCDTNNAEAEVSYAVSGATTVAASDNYSGRVDQSNTASYIGASVPVFFVHTGLTAGSNTFTMQYKVNAGTGFYADRRITVFPL